MNYIDVKNFRKYEQLFGDNGPAKIGHVNAVIKALNETISSDMSMFAPINSPTFTGTVVLPATTSIGTVSSTEISYLDGVTSAIQTQLNAKAPSSGINATAIANGSVSNTEFQYLDGVTSAIQTQLNNRLTKYDGATYDINALVSMTAAEYAAITPDPNTIYFVI